jgi:hypothetical protein
MEISICRLKRKFYLLGVTKISFVYGKNNTNIKSYIYKQHERRKLNLGESSMELLVKGLIEEHLDKKIINQQLSLNEEIYSINAAKRKKKEEDEDDIEDEEDDLFDEEEEEEENPFEAEPTEEDIIEDDFPVDEDDLFEEDEDSLR